MEKRELQIDYMVYEKTYPEGYGELCEKALRIIPQAYSVYSGFQWAPLCCWITAKQ